MERRDFLRSIGSTAALVTGVSGVAAAESDRDSRRHHGPTDKPQWPYRTDFDVIGRSATDHEDDVELVDASPAKAVFQGSIAGRNSCVGAELVGVDRLDPDTVAFTVQETYRDGICAQVLTGVEYELSTSPLAGDFDTAVVVHEDATGTVTLRESFSLPVISW
ncbi:hypothetical protein Huta_0363 [Halorhabdus utahensis DSM 12940]|uniref:Uncharacterized protein n=1 Tax=Halorhabdus utahensis (strain DSM 12940 / JCM 11049 / AX-2) TaxID=519442 RepID=C7NRB3_HALUD|nr:hypothetical protein [Halorhabdus utahensis]ACV10550.1 hypothetical protein Huta_0363 [Halorhabdus utahensis DSM 12940]